MPHRPAFLLPLLLAGLACAPPQAAPGSPGHAYGAGVRSREVLKTGVAADGKRLSVPRFEDPELTVLEVDLAPGAETGWHLHPVPVHAYLLEGELTVTLATGAARTYRKGEAIAEAVDLAHNGRNASSATARLVVFYCGAKGVPNVVKQAPPVR